MLNQKIFSSEIVNAERQPELDLAKAVIIFTLAPVHCIIECTSEEALSHGIPFLFDSVIGGPFSAPMFMFAMGIGMFYTENHTPKDYACRGIRIGIIGYMLNLCRFLIPFLAGYWITGDHEKYIAPLLYRMLGNDILQFACLAMLFMALLVRLHVPRAVMFWISLGMSLLGSCLNGVDMGTAAGNIFWGYLIGTEDAAGKVFSDFPLLNWMIFPVSGYLFGSLLVHVKNKKIFYRTVSFAGILFVALYFPTHILNRWGMFGEGQNCYYHMSTADAMASLALTIGMLGIYYILSNRLPEKVIARASEISRNINKIYCIHWVFVMVITNDILYITRGMQELPVLPTMLLGTGISVLAIRTARFLSAAENKRDSGGQNETS